MFKPKINSTNKIFILIYIWSMKSDTSKKIFSIKFFNITTRELRRNNYFRPDFYSNIVNMKKWIFNFYKRRSELYCLMRSCSIISFKISFSWKDRFILSSVIIASKIKMILCAIFRIIKIYICYSFLISSNFS